MSSSEGLDYSNNHVFETSEIFSLFCRAQELRDAGDATVVYRKYTTLENRHWGIQAGKKIKVVFVWTEKTVKWELQLPDKTQAAINSGAYDSPGTAGFPYLGTFSPKPDGSDFTAVLPEQGNLYASLTEWSLRQNQAGAIFHNQSICSKTSQKNSCALCSFPHELAIKF